MDRRTATRRLGSPESRSAVTGQDSVAGVRTKVTSNLGSERGVETVGPV